MSRSFQQNCEPELSGASEGSHLRQCRLSDRLSSPYRTHLRCSPSHLHPGNHAQGVALAGKTLGIRAIIVMPKGSPAIKVNGVKQHGGEVILHGNDFDEAKAECIRLAKEG